MKLYLVRHGDYFTNESYQDALSEKGVNEIKQLANFLSPLLIHVDSISHSGKIRAQQTAELLSETVKSTHPPKEREGLKPNDPVSVFADELAYEEEDMIVVGHMPFMSRLVGLLVVGDENKEIVAFHTGTMVCLESLDPTHWVIQWVYKGG